jgi:hypothetical protein
MSPLATAILMGAAFLAIVGLDVYLALDGRDENTYSERLRALGRAWPPARLLIVYGMGLLSGHLYW